MMLSLKMDVASSNWIKNLIEKDMTLFLNKLSHVVTSDLPCYALLSVLQKCLT